MKDMQLPISEHIMIGLELCAMRERLCLLGVKVSGCQDQILRNSARNAAFAIDKLRDLLNEQVISIAPPSHSSIASRIYDCTERLHYLRETDGAQLIGERILGIDANAA